MPAERPGAVRDKPALRAMVVDDEGPARGELAFLLRRSPTVASVDEAADGAECLDLLTANEYDALFVDARMPGLDGLALARLVQRGDHPPRIVIVSAYEEYALEAFGVAAFDYLLKPVRKERLQLTLKRLLEAARHDRAAESGGGDAADSTFDRIAVTSQGKILVVPVDEIRLAELDGPRVYVHTGDGRYPSRLTLRGVEERLASRGFLRVHRRYIVNLRHVRAIEPFFNGTYMLRVNGLAGVTVPVSRRHGRELRALVNL